MNELSHLTRRHYERNEADASLVSKVTRILDSLPDGSVDSSQLVHCYIDFLMVHFDAASQSKTHLTAVSLTLAGQVT